MKTSQTSKKQQASCTRSHQSFLRATSAQTQTFFQKGQAAQSEPFFKPSGVVAGLQAKLTVGAAGDRYEQEADAVAAQVVTQLNQPQSTPVGNQSESVQREGNLEEDETLQTKPISPILQRMDTPEEDEDTVQTKPALQRIGQEGGAVGGEIENEIQQARGSGQQLAPNLQAQMGAAMGADFSGVRVHTDTRSHRLNQSIQAKAFTTGQDVFFRQGAYQPQSRGGQELIAHELTHVVQQQPSRKTTENTTLARRQVSDDGVALKADPIRAGFIPAGLATLANESTSPSLRSNKPLQLSANLKTQTTPSFTHPLKAGPLKADSLNRQPLLLNNLAGIPQNDIQPFRRRRSIPKPNRVSDSINLQAAPMGTGLTITPVTSTQLQADGWRKTKAVGKGFGMSFVNAIAGPLKYIVSGQRKDLKAGWAENDKADAYANVHLARMAKAALVFKELGAFAGWVGLLSSIGSLIAAAFAPAGLAASAILSSIAGIAGVVAGSAGLVSGILSTILAVSNLRRALAIKNKKSIQRQQHMLMFWKDFAGAISGLIAAVGGVVGATTGGIVADQSSIANTLSSGGGMTALGTDLAKGAAGGQAFAVADEVQGALTNAKIEKDKEALAANPRTQDFAMAQQAANIRSGMNPMANLQTKRNADAIQRKLDSHSKSNGWLQREESSESETAPAALNALNKVGQAAQGSVGFSATGKQQLATEQAEQTSSMSALSKTDGSLDELQTVGSEHVNAHLGEMAAQSASGEQAIKKDKMPNENTQETGDAATEQRANKLEKADQALDQLEQKSGESFAAQKKTSLKSVLRKGITAVISWFKSRFLNLKSRVKKLFAKIRSKVAGFLVKAVGLEEPIAGLKEMIVESQAAAPEMAKTTGIASQQAGSSNSLAQQLSTSVESAKASF